MNLGYINPIGITFEDVEELAWHDPIVHACLMYYIRGDVSREKALMACVVGLSKVLSDCQKQLIEELSLGPFPNLLIPMSRDRK